MATLRGLLAPQSDWNRAGAASALPLFTEALATRDASAIRASQRTGVRSFSENRAVY